MGLVAVEWSKGIEDAWSDIATFVPKLIGFLLILIIGYIVVKVIARVVDSLLERVGFDKVVERGGVKKVLDKSKFDASDIVAKIIFYTLFLMVLQMAFGVFGDNPISDLLSSVIAYIPKVLAAIIIIVIAAAIAAAVRELIDASLGELSYGKMLANAAGVAILTLGVFAALDQLEIAASIVTGLFYAMLAIIVGVTVVAVGGGGIGAMKDRWERALNKLDEEVPAMKEKVNTARPRVEARLEERKNQAKDAAAPTQGATATDPRRTR